MQQQVLMLRVYIDEVFANAPQRGKRDGGVVDEGS